MRVIKEFRDFAIKGNVVDMAVGIIIGAAFGKIVSSLVNDVLMPPLGLAMGGMDFSDKSIELKSAIVDATGKETAKAVVLHYGMFINTIIDFTIVAFAIFLMVKAINAAKKKEAAAPAPAPPSKQELLLTEIRDLLKAR
jgi:large conductance mechanosensitive channel